MKSVENKIAHIGSKIKYYRLLNKISLSKLANDASISKSTLFGLEEGRSNPTISTLLNIASTLGISLNELIGRNLEDSNNSKLTLVSEPANETYKLYKLLLLPNEFFKLKDIEASSIKIEVTDGAISVIDKAITLYINENIVVDYNSIFKAYDTGATVMLKIYKKQPTFYIKEDIFYNSSSKELIEESILNTQNKLINRVIFTSITPMSDIKTTKYINYIEILTNKESHYYIFKRYQGLLGGINRYLKHLDNNLSSNYLNIEKFINSAICQKSIKKDTFDLIDNNILDDIKNILIDITKNNRNNVNIVNSIFDINNSILNKNNYILLIEELADNENNLENTSLTLWLYRALESLYITEESSLNSNELEVFNKIIQELLKALYLSYNGYLNQSLNIIRSLNLEINRIKIVNIESKFIKNYIYVSQELENIINRNDKHININTTSLVEAISKDLNIEIEIKELISPVIDKSGLYAYLFRVN